MKQEIIDFKNSAAPLRARWEKYITDWNISLDDRWEVFLEAPDEWKYHDGCGPSLSSLNEIVDSPYDDLGVDRGQTMFIEDVIERLEGNEWSEPLADASQIVRVKEEALAQRYNSFTYDW